jgi:hypothetical protein
LYALFNLITVTGNQLGLYLVHKTMDRRTKHINCYDAEICIPVPKAGHVWSAKVLTLYCRAKVIIYLHFHRFEARVHLTYEVMIF